MHVSTLLCSTTNPFPNCYYAVNDGANAHNMEADERERKRIKWYRRGVEGVEKKRKKKEKSEEEPKRS